MFAARRSAISCQSAAICGSADAAATRTATNGAKRACSSGNAAAWAASVPAAVGGVQARQPSQSGGELVTSRGGRHHQRRDARVAGGAVPASGRNEVVARDRHLVPDREVVQTGDRAGRDTLEPGAGVGQLLGQGVGRIGPGGMRGERPGQPRIGQRAQPVGHPLDRGGEVRGT